ncbi:hypothetical protein EDB80DRAFT_888803 [Ilyonectria destructans]|nr:hypothetical protein EDB80DRAFT_888803 [Ilyonectria destructans]
MGAVLHFTSGLAVMADHDVSLRYAYGEISLTRLNLYAPLALGQSHFQKVEYQYGTYLTRFFGPILKSSQNPSTLMPTMDKGKGTSKFAESAAEKNATPVRPVRLITCA